MKRFKIILAVLAFLLCAYQLYAGEPNSVDKLMLKKILKWYPEADVNRDGIVTKSEAVAFMESLRSGKRLTCSESEYLEGHKTQVVIIGTIHTNHYKNPQYSPEILKEIILSLRPDAILIESPLSQVDLNGKPLERFRTKDPRLCPENWVADEVAMQLGIKQIPFDQPDREEYYRKTNYLKRDQEYKQAIQRWMKTPKKDDPNCIDLNTIKVLYHIDELQSQCLNNPQATNSEAFDALHKLKTQLLYEIAPNIMKQYGGYEAIIDEAEFLQEVWQNRNKIMSENIIRTAKQYAGKRLVVLTGHWHRYILKNLLKNEKNLSLKEYWEIIKAKDAKP